MSRNEIEAVLAHPYDLSVRMLYGCGLRLFECLKLRINNFNLDDGIITVHDGKGKKDRTVPLPESLMPAIRDHFESVYELHEKDLASKFGSLRICGKMRVDGSQTILVWHALASGRRHIRDVGPELEALVTIAASHNSAMNQKFRQGQAKD